MYSCRLLLPLLHLLAIHVYRFSTMYTQAHWLYISVTPPLIGCVVLLILCLSTLMKYSLRPKKQVTLGFKICSKKQFILPYLESACACKNQLVPNMDNK